MLTRLSEMQPDPIDTDHLRGHIKRVLSRLKTHLDAKRLETAPDPVEQAREDASLATQPDQKE